MAHHDSLGLRKLLVLYTRSHAVLQHTSCIAAVRRSLRLDNLFTSSPPRFTTLYQRFSRQITIKLPPYFHFRLYLSSSPPPSFINIFPCYILLNSTSSRSTVSQRYRCAIYVIAAIAALSLLSLGYRCVIVALSLRYRCAIAALSLLSLRYRCVIVALSLRYRCAIAALSLHNRCAIAALSLRYRCAIAALSLSLCYRCAFTALSHRYRCAIASLSLHYRCAIAALLLRSRCMIVA
jgi:hypothetical protein